MFHRRRLLVATAVVQLLFLCSESATGSDVRITSSNDFITFLNNVNNGTSYKGTTVYLDYDLSLPEVREPIGLNATHNFNGIFDGQGYIISDLKVNSSSNTVGLFGYSKGLTVRNVIIDSSCSLTSSYNEYDNTYIGGIIGNCYVDIKKCIIENSVNMASITFKGKIGYKTLLISGIVGHFYSISKYDGYVKNCANYGVITHSGTSGSSYIGGIVGSLSGEYRSLYKQIRNCLNYGIINHNGSTSSGIYLGGIVGYCYYAYIENCVSAGKIFSRKTGDIRNIVGYINDNTNIYDCYYTNELGFNKYESSSSVEISNILRFDNATFNLEQDISIGDYQGNSLIDALNAAADYYTLRDYSHWLLNKESKSVSFSINNRNKPIEMNYQIILTPSLTNEGSLFFDGWYTNNEYTSLYTLFEITSDTSLYGKFEENTNKYTITFDTRGGTSVAPITAQFGTVVELPNNPIKNECNIAFWETVYGDNMGLSITMPAHNITLYVVWKCAHIRTSEDFSDFSKIVKSGTSYSGTTVYLDSDLSLPEFTEPIGDSNNYFRGVFDGQGHVISDLKMNSSSSHYMGLFKCSYGMSVKNVILDDSCFFMNTYKGSGSLIVGGIIGFCQSFNVQSNFENCVNMARITFNGNATYVRLSGIAGSLAPHPNFIYVKNCVNYGAISHLGNSSTSYIGGIAAELDNLDHGYTYNCFNYGTITHNGSTTSRLYLGGIIGYGWFLYINNCVSAGNINILDITTGNIGNIIGYVRSYTYISYCYYSGDLTNYAICGGGSPSITNCTSYDSSSFKLEQDVSIGDYQGNSLIDALNNAADYYTLRDYSHWLLNKEGKSVSFTINDRNEPIEMNYQIILAPSLASEGSLFFNGWYTNNEYTSLYTLFEITSDTSLYGKFEENTNQYSISFDTRGGTSVAPITAQFGTTVSLPSNSLKESCSIAFWENVYEDKVGFSITMPAHNITLYAVWKCTHIRTPGDFSDFTKIVNSEVDTFSGSSVYLDSDLSLREIIEPVGDYYPGYFLGTFDGQGHIISDLNIISSSIYLGLFGYSKGLTIRNVVLDSSCSIMSSYSGYDNIYIGGIIGYCTSSSIIENIVNMANITFNGNISSNTLYIGGIAGSLSSSRTYNTSIKNCVNYGTITFSGAGSYSYIGGIVGYFYGYPRSGYEYIYNCLNYAAITYRATLLKAFYLGGVTGYSSYTYIKNCLSTGKISSSETNYTGSFVGKVYTETYIDNCYYTNDVRVDSINGTGIPKSITDTPEDPTSVSTAVSNLNNKVSSEDGWNKWVLNANNETVTFKVNNNKGYSVSSQAILLPDPTSNSSLVFSGWYTDAYYKHHFKSDVISESVVLYSLYGEAITVIFNATGGIVDVTSKEVVFDSFYGELPTPIKENYSFVGWFNDKNEIVTNETTVNITTNHTLYAQWLPVNYTVTFNATGGIVDVTSKEVAFDSFYGELPTPIKEGYTFVGWFNDKNEIVTNETIFSIPNNHTLYAHWKEEIPTSQVEIVFEAKDLRDEEIETIVKEYTDAEFTIVRVDDSETGETRIIIKFNEIEKAEEFVRTVREINDTTGFNIKRVNFNYEELGGSFSPLYYPFSLLFFPLVHLLLL